MPVGLIEWFIIILASEFFWPLDMSEAFPFPLSQFFHSFRGKGRGEGEKKGNSYTIQFSAKEKERGIPNR
jgi:hypothetical protein